MYFCNSCVKTLPDRRNPNHFFQKELLSKNREVILQSKIGKFTQQSNEKIVWIQSLYVWIQFEQNCVYPLMIFS